MVALVLDREQIATMGPQRHIAQSYVTTISTILSNAFGMSLCISLSASFTQYLWRLVRTEALELSTLDRLWTLRANPFSLFSRGVLRKAWVLVVVASLLWTVPVAVSFPPGAITVIKSEQNFYRSAFVPTFDPSDVSKDILL